MRTQNSIRNTIAGIGGQLFSTVLSFISRTIFIYVLGANYLGVNGLFSNILSMLSLAELGVGSAIIYNMYKPLAEKDEPRLKSLMSLYAKAYRVIGGIVAVIGVSLTPFLNQIIKDQPNIPNLKIIYLLFLTNSVVSYFFIYKSSIIIADQKNYIITVRYQIFNLIQAIIQIIILVLTKNYILYLLAQIVCSFLVNLSISKTADKMYPFLNDKDVEPLDNDSKKTIFKHVTAMMSHKVGGVVVNGTDNILISSFVGVFWVGLYSNYVMIITIINRFMGQIFTAITASIGNLNAKEDIDKSYDVYNKVFFAGYWLYSFCAICLGVLLNPFIKIWLGEKYILAGYIVLVIVINFYISGMRQATITYNTTLGLFWNDRYKPWFEAVINIAASIILLKRFGILGVFLGTFTSTVCTSLWVDPYILFKYGFKRDLVIYFKKYIKYTCITIIAAIITSFIAAQVIGDSILSFVIKCLICVIIPNVVIWLFTYKMEEYKYFKNLVDSLLKKILKR